MGLVIGATPGVGPFSLLWYRYEKSVARSDGLSTLFLRPRTAPGAPVRRVQYITASFELGELLYAPHHDGTTVYIASCVLSVVLPA